MIRAPAAISLPPALRRLASIRAELRAAAAQAGALRLIAAANREPAQVRLLTRSWCEDRGVQEGGGA